MSVKSDADERLIARFNTMSARVLADVVNDAEADEFAEFISSNRAALTQLIPSFAEQCKILSDFYVAKAEAILTARLTDGCGKCRACVAQREARERIVNPEAEKDRYGYN